jgi:hypothetical protein
MGPREHSAYGPKILARLADPEQRVELQVARDWGLTPSQFRALPDEDRDLMLAEKELVCPSCGNLRSLCSDPNVPWYPQRSTCYATASLEVVRRRLRKKHEKDEPGSKLHPLDGMGVWVSQFDLTPDDDFI